MVVVAIIGVLALLGLRLYTGQQEKAKNAIVIANASTVHTLIQGEMLDHSYTSFDSVLDHIAGLATSNTTALTSLANMKNPYDDDGNIVMEITGGGTDVANDSNNEGAVVVAWAENDKFYIQGLGANGVLTGSKLTALK